MKEQNNKILIIITTLIVILLASLIFLNQDNKKTGSLNKINYKELTKKIENKDSFILIVSQSTCTHCASYKPKVEIIAKKHKLNIYYIDYDLEKDKTKEKFLEEYDLDGSTPITLFIKKGKQTSIFDRIEGDISDTKVIEKFKKMRFIK